ncbi:hypothetical protein [Nocardiopsis potens]|uniref:hypothetical protein n=1 Tax=Nocardiopsis potens TaxID=1246458 RepID=UPI000594E976|nr:hypothetical protein [Nocardiopsis potens]
MLKIEHEFMTELLQNDPGLVAELAELGFGVRLPPFAQATLESNRTGRIDPPELTADSVVLLRDPAKKRMVHGKPTDAVAGIIAEVQRGEDPGKRLSRPCYIANLRHRIDAPVLLVVLCPRPSAAPWARRAIPTGHPGFTLEPLVLGPAEVPVVTDPEALAESPELGVLSTLLHADEDVDLVDVMMEGLDKIDPSRAEIYTRLVMVLLEEAPRHRLEVIVASAIYDFTTPFTERYVEKGRAEGIAKMILKVSDARGIAVGDEVRERVLSCTDVETLDTWGGRAAVVSSADEIFG